jgi:DNA invertase Pin-like site-specific DNA recombinase
LALQIVGKRAAVLLDMLGVFSEFETNLRCERQLEGIAEAKAKEKYKGRVPKTMAKAATARAPRGTKILTKAFFDAALQIPETVRANVVKASLALIRETLKGNREKATATKAKTKPSKEVKAVKAVPKKKIGRPVGSKNKPKVVARKTRVSKQAPVMDVAAD